MKKAIRALLTIAAAGLLLSGCGRSEDKSAFSPAQTCVYVSSDGSVSSAQVLKMDDKVDHKDLEQYLEAAVIMFNKENGGGESAKNRSGSDKLPAALQSVTLQKGVATAIFDYASVEDLAKFRDTREQTDQSNTVTGVEVRKVSDAAGAGWLSGSFLKPDGGRASADEVKKKTGANAACIEGGGIVMFSGKVLFMSEGVSKKDERTVSMPDSTKSYVVFE